MKKLLLIAALAASNAFAGASSQASGTRNDANSLVSVSRADGVSVFHRFDTDVNGEWLFCALQSNYFQYKRHCGDLTGSSEWKRVRDYLPKNVSVTGFRTANYTSGGSYVVTLEVYWKRGK